MESGVIETSKKETGGQRLQKIKTKVLEIAQKYPLNTVGMESLYFARNAKSALKVAEAIGVMKLTLSEIGLEVKELTPLQVKMAIVGYGRAEKRQVQEMIKIMLSGQVIEGPSHVADAVAVALCIELGQKNNLS